MLCTPMIRNLNLYHCINTIAQRLVIATALVLWPYGLERCMAEGVVSVAGFAMAEVAMAEVAMAGSAIDGPPSVVDFARDVAPILRERCSPCHSGSGPKGGLDVTDSSALMGYIEAGNPAASSLWTDYLRQPAKSTDPKSTVMPPDGPLRGSELAVLQTWIQDGANWPSDFRFGDAPSSQARSENRSWLDRLYHSIGYFHPAMVHFPIVLFVLSAACAILSPFLGLRCQSTAFHCLVLAVLLSAVTAFMGWSFAYSKGYPAWNRMLATNASAGEQSFFYHRWLGTSVPILGAICVVVGMIGRRTKSGWMNTLWRVGAVVLGGIVGLVGHQGGYLVYGDLIQQAIEQWTK